MDRIEIVSLAGAVALLAVIFEAIRKRRLREEYSLLWLLTGLALLVFALWRDLLHELARVMGVYYPPSALLLIGFGGLVLILLSFSTTVSDLSSKVTTLSQRQALLEHEVERLLAERGDRTDAVERFGSEGLPADANQPALSAALAGRGQAEMADASATLATSRGDGAEG